MYNSKELPELLEMLIIDHANSLLSTIEHTEAEKLFYIQGAKDGAKIAVDVTSQLLNGMKNV
jgi:hypothetical protein